MDRKKAYEIVFNDLCKCNLFKGSYDTKHGNKYYMYGIDAVMEFIAYKISETNGDKFSDMFFGNIIESEKNNKYDKRRSNNKN